MRGLNNIGMLRESEIIIGAHIENRRLIGDLNECTLRGADHSLCLVSAGITNLVYGAAYILADCIIHLITIFSGGVKASRALFYHFALNS